MVWNFRAASNQRVVGINAAGLPPSERHSQSLTWNDSHTISLLSKAKSKCHSVGISSLQRFLPPILIEKYAGEFVNCTTSVRAYCSAVSTYSLNNVHIFLICPNPVYELRNLDSLTYEKTQMSNFSLLKSRAWLFGLLQRCDCKNYDIFRLISNCWASVIQKQVALEEQPKKTVKVTLHPKFDHCPASKV